MSTDDLPWWPAAPRQGILGEGDPSLARSILEPSSQLKARTCVAFDLRLIFSKVGAPRARS